MSSTSDKPSDSQLADRDFLPPIDSSLTVSDLNKLNDWNNAQRENTDNTKNRES